MKIWIIKVYYLLISFFLIKYTVTNHNAFQFEILQEILNHQCRTAEMGQSGRIHQIGLEQAENGAEIVENRARGTPEVPERVPETPGKLPEAIIERFGSISGSFGSPKWSQNRPKMTRNRGFFRRVFLKAFRDDFSLPKLVKNDREIDQNTLGVREAKHHETL